MLADLEQGYLQRVAFVVPAEATWTLPLYELALMTARQAWSMGMDRVRLTLVTPEDRPLAMFGAPASDALAELLDDHAIDFVGSSYPSVGRGYVIADPGGRRIDADRIVALPALDGRGIDGVPADADGFIPVDAHGRVPGLPGVFAAGDGTSFPIKQGGLATQQADAVAEAIAAAVGAPVEPEPFRPVLRGLLLTGGDDRFLRNAVAGGGGEGEGRRAHAVVAADEDRRSVHLRLPVRPRRGRRSSRRSGHGHLEVEIPLEAHTAAGHS